MTPLHFQTIEKSYQSFLEELEKNKDHFEFCTLNDFGTDFEILFAKQGVNNGLFSIENAATQEKRNIKRQITASNLSIRFMQASFVTDNNQIKISDTFDQELISKFFEQPPNPECLHCQFLKLKNQQLYLITHDPK